jgi:predicted RNA-binding Zn-ribbon protein involved in translation (DUF1610 family)
MIPAMCDDCWTTLRYDMETFSYYCPKCGVVEDEGSKEELSELEHEDEIEAEK